MAGEYYRWLAKDVKPEEKRELTREEKIKNWWYYHKWYLLAAAAALFLVLDIAGDMLSDYRNRPDYSVAYVGSSYLPEDTVEQLSQALAGLGEDLNGNGKVQVAVHQYIVYAPESEETANSVNTTMLYSEQVQLAADLENCDSYFFLMENPEQFQADYGILAGPEGSDPEHTEGECFRWSDCPVLRELELGSFTVETLEAIYTGESREVLAGLYLGRRAFSQEKTCEYPQGCEDLWNRLTRDAEK